MNNKMKAERKIIKETKKERDAWIRSVLRDVYQSENSENSSFLCDDIFLRDGCIGASVIC